MMEEKKTLRIIAFFAYFLLLEVTALSLTGLSIFSIVYIPIQKLRIWQQFDPVNNLLPILTCVAAVITVICPIVGAVGVVRKSQRIISLFVGLMTLIASFWFAIGGWCLSKHGLILGDIEHYMFKRLERDGAYDYSRQFLLDLSEHMPRINAQYNFRCCQVISDTSLSACAPDCGYQYKRLFETVIFPVIYTCVFGAGTFSLLALLSGCLVCCYLDDVRPAF